MIQHRDYADSYPQGYYLYSHVVDPNEPYRHDVIYCDQWFKTKDESETHVANFWKEVYANIDDFGVLVNLMQKYNFKYARKESIH